MQHSHLSTAGAPAAGTCEDDLCSCSSSYAEFAAAARRLNMELQDPSSSGRTGQHRNLTAAAPAGPRSARSGSVTSEDAACGYGGSFGNGGGGWRERLTAGGSTGSTPASPLLSSYSAQRG
uniref:Uncharacterized protein n=1 Tax=Macrostomum lignano TaxID=282301 RepID=A0A1I8HL85_9PLAT